MSGKAATRRERGRLERRRRVKEAAAAIFAAKGYDAATTREIARRAKVATGTVFVYARDKRELLMMVMNDRLDRLGDTSLTRVAAGKSLLDQLMRFFAEHYAVWAEDAELSRCAVRETFSYVKDGDELGPEVLKFFARLPRNAAVIAAHIRERQALGRVRRELDPDRIARLTMAIYLNELRHWLADHRLDLEAGLDELRELLRLALMAVETPALARAR